MRCAFGLVLGLVLALLASCASVRVARAQASAQASHEHRESRAEVDAFAAEVDAMAEGRTRAEADLFLGDVYRGRFGDLQRAAKHFRRAEASVELDDLGRRLARGGLVDALLAMGSRDDAATVAARSGDAVLLARVRTAIVRHRLHITSIAALAGFALLAVGSIVRARARARALLTRSPLRRFSAVALFFATWVGGMGAILARAYDESSPWPFVGLALAVLPIAILARAWALTGGRAWTERTLRAALAASASLAAAFLVLEIVDAQLLAGFGL